MFGIKKYYKKMLEMVEMLKEKVKLWWRVHILSVTRNYINYDLREKFHFFMEFNLYFKYFFFLKKSYINFVCLFCFFFTF